MRAAALISLALSALLALSGEPAFAQDPGGQAGKDDPVVSPLIDEFIAEREAAAPQPSARGAGYLLLRGQSGDGAAATRSVTEGSGKDSPSPEPGDDPVRFDSSGNVQVYIHLENADDAALQQLRDLGATIEITNADRNVVQAWLPTAALERIAALSAVTEITPPDYAETRAGRVSTEGDRIHRADLVRSFSGLSGSGVRVGVISDGVDAWRTSQGGGDLPGSIEINPDQGGSGDEGTALLEIVHDLAPGAELAFSGAGTSLGMVEAILWLANDAFEGEGADIIVDDLGFYTEPFYEDGAVALAAADAVAGGAVYVSASGNNASKHYEGQFSDGGDGYHDFDASGATDIALRISPGVRVVLQWNDRFGASGNDYDLFVCPPGIKPVKFNLQNDICEGSNRGQSGDDDPYESIFTVLLDYSAADVYIRRYSGDAKRLKLFVTRGAVAEHGVQEGGIFGHPAVTGVLAVGAIDAADPGSDDPQFTSDRGSTRIFFPSQETRSKPDVMGIDGVLITGAGGFGAPTSGSSFRRFFGTSAAAPHVAGIAALALQAQRRADPSMTRKAVADAVTKTLRDTAIDLGEPGRDETFGHGRADARAAIESIAGSSASLDLYPTSRYAETFTVDSTGDGADDDTTDGACDDGTGSCTLRAAIQQTNAGSGAIIEFDIPGAGTRTIGPASALPTVTEPVFIDGYSQPGAGAEAVLIAIDGTGAGGTATGLTLRGNGSFVRGLAVGGFGRHGIRLESSSRHVLTGNMIGTDASGAADEGNGWSGVYVTASSDVLLDGNVISGNGRSGVETSAGSGIRLRANKIGTNAAGTADLGNSGAGVTVSSRSVVISDNVISGNDGGGVHLDGSAAADAIVSGNRIGTNDAGDAAVGNTGSGIFIDGHPRDNVISGNIIGGNGSHGVRLYGAAVRDNLIAENHIGANDAGTDLGNGGSGVHIGATALGGPDGNTIERNVIAHNGGDGVTIVGSGSTGNTVWENSIHSNTGHGIDLGDDGPTANDGGDGDSGPNHLQNHPSAITLATRDDVASARFTLDVIKDRIYVVDYYSCDSSAGGEGKEWLGFSLVRGSRTGSLTFSPSTLERTMADFTAPAATHVTAAATDQQTGSTSEFAPCVARVALPGLVISESIVEATEDAAATYTIALSALPAADVTVTLTPDDTGVATVSDTALTFTTTGGTSAQTVIVTPVSDDDAEDAATQILHEVSIGADSHPTALVAVEVTDDEAPALTLASTHAGANFPADTSVGHFYDGSIGSRDNPFDEDTTAAYTAALSSEPDGDVTVYLSSSDTGALTVSPSSITFTKTGDASDAEEHEWDDPQTVTLTAVSDSDAADEIVRVFHSMIIGSRIYQLGRVLAIVRDPDLPGLIYSPAGRQVAIGSESGTATYTLQLESEPISDVTVDLSSSNAGSVTVSPASITFTRTGEAQDAGKYEWDDAQTVTAAAVADDDEFDDLAFIRHQTTIDSVIYSWASVLVAVADGNRAPFFEEGLKATRYIDENSAEGAAVGAPVAATDLNGDTLTYEIDVTEGGPYTVDTATGQIRLGAGVSLDHEQGTAQEVKITASDPDGLSDTIEVAIEIADVNEPPTVTGDAALSFPENTAITRVLDRYTATDPERGAITWSVGGLDSAAFTIDAGGSLRFAGPPDYETQDELSITVVATDDGDPAQEGTFAVTVELTDVDEPPQVSGDDALTFPENTAAATVLETYRATDPEGVHTTFTWSLAGTDRGDLEISAAGELTFASAPDYDRPADSGGDNVYSVQVRASDGARTGTLSVTVTVTNLNEPPSTPAGDTAITVAENSSGNLARYSATDPDRGDTVTWDISGTDADDFTIDPAGNLTFRDVPDYEAPGDAGGNNVYEVSVEAKDAELTSSLAVTVTVSPVDERPVVTGATAIDDYDENGTGEVATYAARDPEGATTTFTWSLSGPDRGDFQVSSAGVLTFRAPPDYERPADSGANNEYLVTVAATDAGRLQGTLDVAVTVSDVNEPPTITGDDTASFPENSVRAVATYRAADPERRAITWSVSGTDGGDFEIGQGGVLTFAATPDFENPADADQDNVYLVRVQARDDGANTAALSVTVTVTNSTGTEEPTITTTRDPSPYRESGTGPVHTFRARDPQGRPVGWSVTGTDGLAFEVSPGGVLTFRSPPDFESPADADADNRYEIKVVATDEQGLTDAVDVTVTVTNDAEGVEPTITTRNPPATYRENGTSAVYTLSASDPQRGPITWTLAGADAGDLTITADGSGRGVLAFSTSPDYESPTDSDRDNLYAISVVATDEDGHADRLSFTVSVTDVNERPEVSGRQSLSFAENQPTDRVLATYTATDPEDPGSPLTRWSVSGTDAGDFTISESGELFFRNVPDYERPADSGGDNVYSLSVRAYDGQSYGYLPVTVTVQGVDEPPTITTTSRTLFSHLENSATTIHTFRATDPEGADISWSLGGTDGEDFDIYAGIVTFRGIPDYETPADADANNHYFLTVQALDESSNTASLPITVTVTDVNEGPEVSGNQVLSFTENQPTDRVLFTYAARDPEGATITRWSLAGTDAGDFTIDESGGLTFRSVPDHERPADSGRDNVYTFSVRASDGSLHGYLPVTVTVTNVNEPPTITTTSRTSFTFRENGTATIYTFRATDPEGAESIEWLTAGADGSDFTIEDGVLRFAGPPDFEAPQGSGFGGAEYLVTVQARDDDRNAASLPVSVTVTNVNEGPEVSGRQSLSFAENQATDRVLATYDGTDPENPGASITRWSLTGTDAGDFTISEDGELFFRNIPDHEKPADSGRDNVYSLSVRASDGRIYGYLPVTVTVTGVNEPPTITTTSGTAFSHQENSARIISTFRATDPEGADIAWSLAGANGDLFAIYAGIVTFRNFPDYETPRGSGPDGEYEVTVQARDDASSTSSLPITVTVTDRDEGPEVTGTQALTFTENQATDRALATYNASDPEDPGASITRWSLSGADAGDFTISESGVLFFRNSPDHERPADSNSDNVYSLSVRASDGRNYGYLPVTVTVTGVNEAPTITTTSRTSFTYRENGTGALYTFRATDPEGDDIEWLTAGVDSSDFAIAGGALTFTNPPDFESPRGSGQDGNEYLVTVQARDISFETASLPITVTVTGQDEGPEVTGTQSLSFDENQATDRVLATYSGRDPEHPFTPVTRWSLTGTDAGDFRISESGELFFRSVPDYERPADSGRDNVYSLSVRASDGSVYGYLAVTVTVTGVNEPPTITTTSRTAFTYRENGTATIYTFRATDPEGDDIFWSVAGADDDDFTISEAGVLVFSTPPDYENQADSGRDNLYEVTVQARDNSFSTASLEVTVTVTDLNEGPEITGTQSLSFTENQAADRVLATYNATDPEDPFTPITRWSLTGTDAGDFRISENGELFFRSVPDYERPADSGRDNVYNLSVRASDGSVYGYLPVTVTVTGVNEPPTITTTSRTAFTFRENGTATIYTFRATDPEGDDIFWSVAGADDDDFTITDGALTFTNPPDFESPQGSGTDSNQYLVTVQARDNSFSTASLEVTITVTGLNEGPEVSGTQSLTFDENQAIDRVLATYSGRDPEDPGASITRWSLTGTDAGDFTISENGELSFRNIPDYERPVDSGRDNVYNLSVRASDGSVYGYLAVTVTVEDVNEAPTITTTSRTAFTYRENGTATIYTFRATDPEGDDIFWSVAGADSSDFTIEEGVLAFANTPDFESPQGSGTDNNEYLVTVQARDINSSTASLPVTVTVTDLNEGPEISGQQSLSFTENQATDRVLATYTAIDPEDPFAPVTRWSLSGTDAGDFTISENGELSFRNVPDYERPADSGRDNIYSFSVRASDGSVYGYLAVTVTVTGVNEPPTITTSSRTSFTYRENGTATIYTFRATDPEGDDIQWLTAGADDDDFTIEEGVLTFSSPPDFESGQGSGTDSNEYLVTVRARDNSFETASLPVTVTVTDLNEGPEVSGTQSLSFDENQAIDRVLATYSGRDPEDPFAPITRWSLSGTDAGDFRISENGELFFRSVPDHERPADSGRDNVYSFSVRASDGSVYGYLAVTVTVTGVNEPPTITTTSKIAFTYRENGTATIYTFRATDPEGDDIQWLTAGADDDDFTIEEGVLTFSSPPDFESGQGSGQDGNEYLVTVQARDNSFSTASLEVTVTVTDLNEGPEVSGIQSLTFDENQAIDRVLAIYSGRDPENPFDPITRWSLTGTDAGDFTMSENGELFFRSVPDHERPADSGRDNVYNLSVRASDGSVYGYLAVTVTVTGVNEAPTITTTSRTAFTYRENGTATIYTFRATDPEGDDIQWLTAGADSSDFAIEEGVLTFSSPPDFESGQGSGTGSNEYLVTVQARDVNLETASLPITVTVTDLNEGPEISGQQSLSFTENQATDRVLASYNATDPEDPSAEITRWSLSGTDAGDFTMSEDGELFFRNIPDHERPDDSGRDNVYSFSVRASDGRVYGYLAVTVTVTGVNEPPTITTTSRTAFTYRENGTATIYTFRATDPEGDDIQWLTSGADGSDFTIAGGALTFTNPPDFEPGQGSGTDGNEYLVTIQARDNSFSTASLPITVTVTDLNEGPEVSGTTSLTFTENQTTDRVLATYSGRDPENPFDPITRWSLTGTDAGDFTMSEDGELSFRNIPDYERPADSGRDNVYNLSVRASDGGVYGYLAVTITVTGVNEPPTITTTSKTSFTYRENGTATIYTFRATDPEGDDIQWLTAGADSSDFTIEEGVLAFANTPDFESPQGSGADGNEYQVTVQARDNGFSTASFPITVTVTDLNEGPEISGQQSLTFTENQAIDRVLATYSGRDPENPFAPITRWSLTGTDAGDFTISENGELFFRNVPDYERPADSGRDNVYNLSVRASDGGVYGYLAVTITVTGVNEPPTITTTSRTSFTYRENGTATIYTFRATDPEGDDIRWLTAGADSSDFTITDGVLTFSSPPDFESGQGSGTDTNEYLVTVQARDNSFETASLPVTVTVTDLNEGPEISGQQSLTFTENQAIDRVLATYSGRDPENPFAPITRWSLTGTDAGDFTISENGELFFRNVPDYERPADSGRDNVYNLSVRASDGSVYGYLAVTVTVTGVNEPPTITTTSRTAFTYRENGTATIYTFRATDPEGDDIRWLTSGSDGSDFTIEGGALTFTSSPDFESGQGSGADGNEYLVTVQARDNRFETASLPVTVTVTDLNEGPEISGQQSLSFTENQATDRVLATYTAIDPEDPSAAITRWSLSGTDAGDFTISENGELSFRNVPDHERPADSGRDNVYNLSVRASDGSVYGYLAVTVTVEDVNEAPAITTTSKTSFTYRENGTATIYTFRAADPERSPDIEWLTAGADAGDFTIAGGALTFASPPDFESGQGSGTDRNEYVVTVQVRDDNFNTASLEVTVTVTDLNEGPEISGAGSIARVENFEGVLATYNATDPEDPGASITRWSLTGTDAGDFRISESGELSFRSVPDYERPADSGRDNVYNLSVRASDGRNYGYLPVTVTVEAADEPPDITGRDSIVYRENGTASLATYRATDPEGETISWNLSGPDGGDLTISDTGVLTFRGPPDYEQPLDSGGDNVYEVTVEATDSGSNTATLAVTITVTNVTD